MAFEDDDYMDAIYVDVLYEDISNLKIYLEEKNVIIDSLQCQLARREKIMKNWNVKLWVLEKRLRKLKLLILDLLKDLKL